MMVELQLALEGVQQRRFGERDAGDASGQLFAMA